MPVQARGKPTTSHLAPYMPSTASAGQSQIRVLGKLKISWRINTNDRVCVIDTEGQREQTQREGSTDEVH